MFQTLFQVFIENELLTGIILSLLLLSIICQIIMGVIYQKLINEAENISTTNYKQLKTFKLKFQNCYQMNGSVPNISVFVDKFISHLKFMFISLSGLKQIASQLVMLSVLMCGIGACMGIIAGDVIFRILPFYIMGIVGLYLFFAVSAFVDVQRRKDDLKINLMDYLENHLLSRLKNNLTEIEEESEQPIQQETLKIQTMKKLKKEDTDEENTEVNMEKRKEIHKIRKEERAASEKDELKAAIAAFSEDEIEELLKELMA